MTLRRYDSSRKKSRFNQRQVSTMQMSMLELQKMWEEVKNDHDPTNWCLVGYNKNPGPGAPVGAKNVLHAFAKGSGGYAEVG